MLEVQHQEYFEYDMPGVDAMPMLSGQKTCLDFYRKRQTLKHLENERPKDLATVRGILLEAVEQVEMKLHALERYFYRDKNCEQDILALAPSVRKMLNQYQLQFVHSSFHVTNIIKYCCSDRQPFRGDSEAIDALRDYDMKIRESLPDDFLEMIEAIKKIVSFLDKYCRSFYKGDGDDAYATGKSKAAAAFMETPFHYELQRAEFHTAILNHLENIPKLGNMYKTEKVIPGTMFGMATNELARRTDCGELLVFLLFPEACQNIRQSCLGIRKWITTDAQYNGFVKADLDAVETKRDLYQKEVISLLQRAATYERRLYNETKEYRAVKQSVVQVKDREAALDKAIADVNQQMDMKLDDIHVMEQDRKALAKPGRDDPESVHEEYQQQFGEITAAIAQLGFTLAPLDKDRHALMAKKQRITDRKEKAAEKKQLIHDIKKQLAVYKKELDEAQEKLVLLEHSHCLLKEIYIFRTAPGVTKKIFLDKPMELRSRLHKKTHQGAATGGHKTGEKDHTGSKKEEEGKIDVLEAAIIACARTIYTDSDWKTVYRNMNFLPPRGLDALEQDIQDVCRKNAGRKPEDRALDILLRWRRCHSHPTLEGLKEAFISLNRTDVIKAIDQGIAEARERSQQRAARKRRKKDGEKPEQGETPEDAIEWQRTKNTQLAAQRYIEKCGMLNRNNAGVKLPAIRD